MCKYHVSTIKEETEKINLCKTFLLMNLHADNLLYIVYESNVQP